MLLDHLVLFVDDLTTAVTRFESKGFTVTPGGTNGPTHNALIVFSNDTYIELIALQSSRARLILRSLRRIGVLALRRWLKRDLQTRLLDWMSGPQGLIDLCFRGTELNEISHSSPLFGIGLTDPVQFKRHRPDGLVVQWTLRGSNERRQPFFIQDATPIDYRIPAGDARTHPNGALGISEVRTGELIEPAVSNARIFQDSALQPGSMSVTIVSESDARDHIHGPEFFNADIHLFPKPLDQQKT
ncbi:MAG: VOC family protein [Pseudomonadota bacterium]|nr:VOC family protein [Pseudomonadota bacterium]